MTPTSKEKDRRSGSSKRIVLLLAFAALVAVVVWLARRGCGGGSGFGFGGGGGGAGLGRGATPPPETAENARVGRDGARDSPPCHLRMTPRGLESDGRTLSVDDAVRACRALGADLVVTGDTPFGESQRVRAALEDGGVRVLERSAPGAQPAPSAASDR